MNNKKLGNDFEQELCEILADHGFWAHNFANRKNGQPADIIAVHGRIAWLIDAKECTGDVFALSRIEFNQSASMELWQECGNTSPYFALKTLKNEIYMLAYDILRDLAKDGKKQLNDVEMRYYGTDIDTWFRIVKSSI